jgi:hypothetical protein
MTGIKAPPGKSVVQGQSRQIVGVTPISKITRAKWIRGVAQVVEHLPCKHEALSSNSSPTHQKKKQKNQQPPGRKHPALPVSAIGGHVTPEAETGPSSSTEELSVPLTVRFIPAPLNLHLAPPVQHSICWLRWPQARTPQGGPPF